MMNKKIMTPEDAGIVPGARFLAKKYGIFAAEANRLAPRNNLVKRVEDWRSEHGLHAQSPLVKGYIRDLLNGSTELEG